MSSRLRPRKGSWTGRAGFALGLCLVLSAMLLAEGKKKKEEQAPAKKHYLETLDYAKIVWPNPPAITRIRFLDHFYSEPFKPAEKKKATWKDRLAGIAAGETSANKPRFQLVVPYGIAIDSKGLVYVADSKVRAVFIFNTQTKEVELIKNGVHARFGRITGLAMDDADRLFVSDSDNRRVIVFDAQRKVESSIGGMVSPGGLAIDNENRFLYVADAGLDQVLVFDADPPIKLLRAIGVAGKEHTLTGLGELSMPSNVAVDAEGNLFVADTWNNRVQVFDAEGKFIRAFGKAGDGPGYFARPKGIAVDGDGHVWVADAVQDRVQVFTPEGQLLIWLGEHGVLPGQFRVLTGLAIDKNNRVFTTEQLAGRLQMFQYVSNADAEAERQRREGKTTATAEKK
jgi:sugar lactone lactonase YvrE